MTWTYDAKAFRSGAGRGDKELFMTGITDTGGAADRSICLADLNAATAAEWPHKGNANGVVKVYYLFINVDASTSTGLIHFGWVKEQDTTDGTIYSFLTVDCAQGDQTIMLNFSDNPIMMSTNFQLTGAIADNYTVLQNDANYTATAGTTAHIPAVGDFVAIYDHATAQYTRLTVYAQYTVI